MNDDLILLLKNNMVLLDKAVKVLQYSFHKCEAIGIKTSYSQEELESFESLVSRFARLCDILLKEFFA